MPAWTEPRGERPPDPDHVAPRGTAAYNDAVQRYHAWVAKNYARGVPLEMLIDRYDDLGNTSHDWKQWTGQFEGTESARPMEYQQELWDIGNFQKNLSRQEEGGGWWGDYHKDPTTGMFFNDPANDPTRRVWYDEWGDLLPNAPGRGPEVEYDDRGRMYFVDRGKEKLATPGEQVYKGGTAAPISTPTPKPMAPSPVSSVATAGRTPTTSAWGAPSVISSPMAQGGRPQRYDVDSERQVRGFNSFGAPSQRPSRYTKTGFSRGF